MSNIFKRNKTYYFRSTLPVELRFYFNNKKEYIKSLRIKNINNAKIITRYLTKKLNLIKETIKMLTHKEILELIEEFKKISFNDIIARNSYLTQDELNNQIRELLKSNNINLIEKEMNDAFSFLAKKDEELVCYGVDQNLGKEFQKQMYQIKINALNEVKNILNAPKENIIKIKISDAIQDFFNTKDKKHHSREHTFRVILNDFLNYCNEKEIEFVHNLTYPFMMTFKNDYYKEKKVAKGTINNYLKMVKLFLDYCKKSQYISFNVSGDIEITQTEREKEENEREPFSIEDIKLIFKNIDLIKLTPQKRKSKYYDEYEVIIKIALYSGLRINEICQLRKKDIKEENGIYYFDINDEDGKTIKNLNSIRKVPIHKNILNEVLKFIKNKDKNIFKIKRDKMSKEFGLFKNKLGFNEKKVFHSFRHTFQDELKQIEVDYIRIQELVGHAPIKKDRMTTRYTRKYKLEILQSEINKLNFLI